MSKEDFHNRKFDAETNLKLDVYRLYIREWLPVFLCKGYHKIRIFDFFAGSGTDSVGMPGSPLIALKEIADALDFNKEKFDAPFKIELYLNDSSQEKTENLKTLMEERIKASEHFDLLNRYFSFKVETKEFKDIFPIWLEEMRKGSANFVFLDPFGIKDISLNVFDLAQIQHTDIMFFVPAAIVNRMKGRPEIVKYFPFLNDADYGQMKGKNVCSVLARAYDRELLSRKNMCYVGSFSIKKGSNVYGLIFISKHPLGMEKFLRTAWKKDALTGAANFDIDNDGIDPDQPSLFFEMDKPTRIMQFQKELRNLIEQGKIKTNQEVYVACLLEGMLPKYAKEVLQKLKSEGMLKKVPAISSYKVLDDEPKKLS